MASIKTDKNFLQCADEVEELLKRKGFNISGKKEFDAHCQYAVAGKTSSGHVRFYKSRNGTTIDLSQMDNDSEILEALEGYGEVKRKKKKTSRAADIQAYDVIGTDESGKGDYFGPLVVAAVYIPNIETLEALEELGVTDSKKVGNSKAGKLAKEIEKRCAYSVVELPPETYNRMYEDFGNLNELMGWAHARAIEDMMEHGIEPEAAISDKFGHERYIKDKLMEHGKNIDVIQEVRGEQNAAVAAASIIARSVFLDKMSGLGINHDVNLPLGAGRQVVKAGKEFVDKHGKDALEKVAKLHFKTTDKITKK